MLKPLFLLCFLQFFYTTIFASEASPRWYSQDQQSQGKSIFLKNCAVCHGEKAQGTENWKKTDANGKYPPPPLNGNAHAWHHSLDALRISVRDGGIKIGGLMPSFKNVLSKDERDKAIAFFQSQWTEELYLKWSKNFKVSPLKVQTNKTTKNPVISKLLKRLNNPNIESIKLIANDQLYQVNVNGQSIYLSKDGQFAIIGDLINLDTGKNVSQ